MGLLSSAKSSASAYSKTENQDKRIVGDGGASILSADRSQLASGNGINLGFNTKGEATAKNQVFITQTDGGAISAAMDFAGRTVDAVAGQGFSELLDLAGSLFERTSAAQADAMGAVSQAYAQADADKGGAIDNRTLLILAAVAAVVAVGVWGKWK